MIIIWSFFVRENKYNKTIFISNRHLRKCIEYTCNRRISIQTCKMVFFHTQLYTLKNNLKQILSGNSAKVRERRPFEISVRDLVIDVTTKVLSASFRCKRCSWHGLSLARMRSVTIFTFGWKYDRYSARCEEASYTSDRVACRYAIVDVSYRRESINLGRR